MSRELVTTEEVFTPPERVLLKPCFTPARTGDSYQVILEHFSQVQVALEMARKSEFVALDFETKGNDISEEIEIAGIGLAWDTGSCYIHWADQYPDNRQLIRDFILSHPGLLAHNVPFDGGVVRKIWGEHASWAACTLASYMFLSNEGWTGQQWGLKAAQTEILLWEETNETELDRWLCVNGYYKGNRLKLDTRDARQLKWEEGGLSPDKGEMWRAPRGILGRYCVLDAESCYLLWTEHLAPTASQFPDYQQWYTEDFLYLVYGHIDQKLWGIPMDRAGLAARRDYLQKEIDSYELKIRTNPKLLPVIQIIEWELLRALADKEPERYLKLKAIPPQPNQFKKDGTLSKAYTNWIANQPKYLTPVESKNWQNWNEKYLKASSGEDPDYQFNLQSGHHMTSLFYGEPTGVTDPEGFPVYKGGLNFPVRVRTESGLPATGVKAMKHFGQEGTLFIERAYLEKELSYIQDYLDRTELRGTMHPGFRMPGTKTGRLSSKGPNLQQVPKSKAVMSLFGCHPGYTLVDLDFSALEPVVATEFSQDPNMMFIYGDGQPLNDIYLYVAAHTPGLKDKVLATGYNPRAPTKDTLAKAKKDCKAIRSIAKTVVLACQYGAGVDKILETLEADNIFLSREQVETIHKGYWELFREVKQFGYDLQRQWKKNGGYVLNGMGRPMCVTDKYKHDILNRFIQSTGHDILVRYVRLYTQELTRRGIPWIPYVLDWHDASAVAVPDEHLEETKEVYLWGLDELNKQLNGTIKLKGTPSWGKDLAAIKEPEE